MSEEVLTQQHLKDNLHDLHILPDVLPLYDFTYNDFAKDVLIRLLSEPLASLDEMAHTGLAVPVSLKKRDYRSCSVIVKKHKFAIMHRGNLDRIFIIYSFSTETNDLKPIARTDRSTCARNR